MVEVCPCCGERQGLYKLWGAGSSPLYTSHLCSTYEETIPLGDWSLLRCSACGLRFLGSDVVKPEVSSYQPGFYIEPEKHLDDAIDWLVGLLSETNPNRTSLKVFGATFKDQTSIDRVELGIGKEILAHTEIAHDSSVAVGAAIESLPAQSHTRDKYDVVFARHCLEHTSELRSALGALKDLLTDSGLMYLEVPDASKFCVAGLSPFIWEEHRVYFDQYSLHTLTSEIGLKVVGSRLYENGMEDSLVLICRRQDQPDDKRNQSQDPSREPIDDAFSSWESRLIGYLKNKLISTGCSRLFVLGAGHLGIKLAVRNLVDFDVVAMIDDDPTKQGKYCPSTEIPVIPSQAVPESDSLVLAAMSPESFERCLASDRWRKFYDSGLLVNAFEI